MKEKLITLSKSTFGQIIRWILVLPAALLATPIANFMTNLYFWIGTAEETILGAIIRIVISVGLGGFAFVYAGSFMAPNYKRIVGIVLCTTLVLINLLAYPFIKAMSLFIDVDSEISWQSYAKTVILILGAIIGCFSVFENYKK